eukprot:814089-Prymnesium_polylepis.2
MSQPNGAGVYIDADGASVTFTNCNSYGNSAGSVYAGGGIHIARGSLQLLSCILDRNEAGHGSALYV